MKSENFFGPWAGKEAFEQDLAGAPDWIDDTDTREGIWTNPTLTFPGQHPFERDSSSIAEQLGIGLASKVAIINAPPSAAETASLVPPDRLKNSEATADLILLFVSSQQEFDRFLPDAANRLSIEQGSALWLCHPRQLPAVETPLPVTAMLTDAEQFGLYNDAFSTVGPDWVCLRLRRSSAFPQQHQA